MLPDPPHKKGYYSKVPKNKTFVYWEDMQQYHSKINDLNDYLGKKERLSLQQKYLNQLDLQQKYYKDERQSVDDIQEKMKKLEKVKNYEQNQKQYEQ